MKSMRFSNSVLFFAVLLPLAACNDDADPVLENEEELITTVRLTFSEGADSFMAEWKDADGDGANAPAVDDVTLEAGKIYNVSVDLLNESTSPVGNISVEVKDEGVEHQFFFVVGGGLELGAAYADEDAEGNPIGLQSIFTTGTPSTGTLAVILRHMPNKTADGVKGGDITHAGGETDLETVPPFSIIIK